MKTNSTRIAHVVLTLTLICASFNLIADPAPIVNFNFTAVPVLISGTNLAVGSKYMFDDAASSGHAVVTIVSATGGATVEMLDDNNLTKPEAFSPRIIIPANSIGMVEFKIEFFNGGGGSNTPRIMPAISATAMDIDGSGSMHEMDALNMGAGSIATYISTGLEISVVKTGNEYLGTNVAGIEYPGVDTTAKQVMFTVANTFISSFTYKAGANNGNASSVTRQKGIYFKGFNYSLGTLPVKYTSFNGVAVDKSVQLKWATEMELNNDHFEVERSFDGNSFKNIGIVLNGFDIAGGTGKKYQFKDNGTALQGKTIAYYRLKQLDIDGNSTYSNVIAVRLQSALTVSMQVYPNPFVQDLYVRYTATETATAEIRIVNMSGQTLLSTQASISKGYNNIHLAGLNNLANGTYVAQLVVNGKVIDNQKVVKN